MFVISVSAVTKTKNRICLDDGSEFVLPLRDTERYGLSEGDEIDDGTRDALWKELRSRSVVKCGQLLQGMDYSRRGLIRKLMDVGFPEDIAQETTERMVAAHYVDDARYAEHYVRCHLKDRSLRRIQTDLRQKGLSDEDIRNAVDCLQDLVTDADECEDEDPVSAMEAAQIRKLMEKSGYHPETASFEEKAKFIAKLMRKGYRESVIRRLADP